MGKFVTRGLVDKMSREEAERAASRELDALIQSGRPREGEAMPAPSTSGELDETDRVGGQEARAEGGLLRRALEARAAREAEPAAPNQSAARGGRKTGKQGATTRKRPASEKRPPRAAAARVAKRAPATKARKTPGTAAKAPGRATPQRSRSSKPRPPRGPTGGDDRR